VLLHDLRSSGCVLHRRVVHGSPRNEGNAPA
jgi:hypothetical protein